MSERDGAINLRILWPLARWIEDVHGAQALRDVAREVKLTADAFDGKTRWVPSEIFEEILKRAHALAGSDEAFTKACVHRFAESYGPMKYMLWALTQRAICETVVKNAHLVTRAGRFEAIASGPQMFHVRYHASVPESHLMCLSRKAQWASGPTMWGMPPAYIEDLACVARGDAYCEYRLRWYERRRAVPVLAGALAGAGAGLGLVYGGHGDGVLAFAMGALGVSLAYAVEAHKNGARNVQVGQEIVEALRLASTSESEARAELLALHQRQREFMRVIEEQTAARTSAVEEAFEAAKVRERSRAAHLRGVSHDIRNPLTAVKLSASNLYEMVDGDPRDVVEDILREVKRVEMLMTQLMDAVLRDPVIQTRPERLVVSDLTDALRRRLRALTFGRDVRTSVFSTREAPADVTIDRLLLDRVVDNLLTNAAKYTERGSIVLELTGTPPHDAPPGAESLFTLKLSDSGPGIPHEKLRTMFEPKRAEEVTAASYGLGLSSTVRLVDQLGGTLTIMSKPGVGTTMWVHLPVTPPERASVRTLFQDELDSVISRVVKFRSVESA